MKEISLPGNIIEEIIRLNKDDEVVTATNEKAIIDLLEEAKATQLKFIRSCLIIRFITSQMASKTTNTQRVRSLGVISSYTGSRARETSLTYHGLKLMLTGVKELGDEDASV